MVRLTDHPDMTVDVYPGRKTAKQQQQKNLRNRQIRKLKTGKSLSLRNLPYGRGSSSLNHSTFIVGSPNGMSLHSKWAESFSLSSKSLIWVLNLGGRGLALEYRSSSAGASPSRRMYSRTALSLSSSLKQKKAQN